MLQQLYGWIQNIAVYLIVAAAVMHAVPGKDYGKYVRFFSGLVLILLLFTPLLKLSGMEGTFRELYQDSQHELERREIEIAEERLEEADILDFLPDEYSSGMESGRGAAEKENGSSIEVEEIRVGE